MKRVFGTIDDLLGYMKEMKRAGYDTQTVKTVQAGERLALDKITFINPRDGSRKFAYHVYKKVVPLFEGLGNEPLCYVFEKPPQKLPDDLPVPVPIK